MSRSLLRKDNLFACRFCGQAPSTNYKAAISAISCDPCGITITRNCASVAEAIWQSLMGIPFNLERMDSTKLGPDDMIVVTTPKMIHAEGAEILSDQMKKAFPDNKVVIMSGGVVLSIINKPDQEAREEHF